MMKFIFNLFKIIFLENVALIFRFTKIKNNSNVILLSIFPTIISSIIIIPLVLSFKLFINLHTKNANT